ncbi:MAG: glycosyltransferase [Planctomycetia bacterium]|nr:glycosyltransferase [Planctomycetia bacterium]
MNPVIEEKSVLSTQYSVLSTGLPQQSPVCNAPDLTGGPGLSLILPAYNESAVIAHSIRDAVLALDRIGLAYEVIVVDDGSGDDTAAVARAAAREFPQVRVLSLPHNAGYGAALREGFRQARFDLLSFTDADGQFDLNEIPRLLAPVKHYDLVCGYRIDRQDHWSRKVYSRGYNLIVRTLLGTRVRDCDCALKIFHREQIARLELECDDFFINAEILTKARLAGLSVTEVGVNHYPRVRGESKVSVWHILPVLRALVKFWWSRVMFCAHEPETRNSIGPRTEWIMGGLLAAASCLLVFPNLSYPLIDPDESRYAQIGREMLDSGDYIVPTRLGRPYLDKPPLLYWLTAISYRLFGVSEAAARLVPALSALATIGLIFLLGGRLLGPKAAWLGGLALLSTSGFLLSARFVFIDTLLALLTTTTLLAGFLACRRSQIAWRWWLLSAVACGLAILAKGPVAAVLCLPPLVIGRWLTGMPRARFRHWLSYLAAVAIVAVPWFLLIETRQAGFLADFFWTHHFDRFRTGLAHAEPFWYYVPALLIGMAPCSILFPATAVFLFDAGRATRGWRSWELGNVMLSAVWMVLLYSCASCKLASYMLPAIPLICLVVGCGLEAILSGSVDHAFLQFVRRHSAQHLVLIFLTGALVTAGVDLFALDGLAAGRSSHWAGLIVLCLLAAGLGVWRQRGGIATRPASWLPDWTAALAVCLCAMAMAMLDFYPGVAIARSKVRPVFDSCPQQLERSAPVVCYGLSHEADSLAFHLVRGQVQNYDSIQADEAVEALAQSPEAVVVAHVDEVHDLYSRLPAGVVIEKKAQCEHVFIGVCTALAPDHASATKKSAIPHADVALAP